ncbi:MAG: DegT/DnrJ/EryC1/StrS family aminotransferase [Rikenellaceae bacterium]|nr:DegT/DnrJ/EryC1/StrS family aminotransferase [Rikenellaceae bacterium]
MNKILKVTTPLLPPLEEFQASLSQIWKAKQITNYGEFHYKLEESLKRHLKVQDLSLFTNGTIALISAVQALGLSGEVITTPYSFVASTHILKWMGITPVFADIEPEFCTIDPDRIEKAITKKTSAILAVHIYGNPCETEKIELIARKHGLKVIYDAAHAFGVEKKGKSLLDEGDLTVMSYHATKVFNTIEGGAVISHDKSLRQKIDYIKNFGIENETEVVMCGINGKMDELRSAYGLICLEYIEAAIAERKKIADNYRKALADVDGVSLIREQDGVKLNYGYFPVFIDQKVYGISRDELCSKLLEKNIMCRRYFYPLITECPEYRNEFSAKPTNLPVANMKASQVICLPIHHELTIEEAGQVTDVIRNKG